MENSQVYCMLTHLTRINTNNICDMVRYLQWWFGCIAYPCYRVFGWIHTYLASTISSVHQNLYSWIHWSFFCLFVFCLSSGHILYHPEFRNSKHDFSTFKLKLLQYLLSPGVDSHYLQFYPLDHTGPYFTNRCYFPILICNCPLTCPVSTYFSSSLQPNI